MDKKQFEWRLKKVFFCDKKWKPNFSSSFSFSSCLVMRTFEQINISWFSNFILPHFTVLSTQLDGMFIFRGSKKAFYYFLLFFWGNIREEEKPSCRVFECHRLIKTDILAFENIFRSAGYLLTLQCWCESEINKCSDGKA